MNNQPAADENEAIYPIYLTNLTHCVTVVVGGGPISERKIRALLAGGASVRLIAPTVTPQLHAWAATGVISWQSRPYQQGDLADAFIAIAATDQRAVNAQVAADAQTLCLLCNVVDRAEEGNFHTPATMRMGDDMDDDIVITIGSTGKQPRRVKQLREWLQQVWDKRPAVVL